MPFLWMRYLPCTTEQGGRRGEADAADEASRPPLHEVRCHAPGWPWGVCITGQSHLRCVGRQKGSPHDSTRSISGFNEMDPPLCGSAFMSHNGSSSQTQP